MEPAPNQPVSDAMKEEFYTCDGCLAGYTKGISNPEDEYIPDSVDPFIKWYEIVLEEGKKRVCCDRALVDLMKCFPNEKIWLKDLSMWLKLQQGSKYLTNRTRDIFAGMYFMIKTSRLHAKKLKSRVDELELKLDVLLDMKHMGEIDAHYGKRKRRDSF